MPSAKVRNENFLTRKIQVTLPSALVVSAFVMHQIKIFRGVESQLPQLETQVNNWLSENNVKVLNIFGNISPQSQPPDPKGVLIDGGFPASDVILIVHYDKFVSKLGSA
jgi:hypothetical protein